MGLFHSRWLRIPKVTSSVWPALRARAAIPRALLLEVLAARCLNSLPMLTVNGRQLCFITSPADLMATAPPTLSLIPLAIFSEWRAKEGMEPAVHTAMAAGL